MTTTTLTPEQIDALSLDDLNVACAQTQGWHYIDGRDGKRYFVHERHEPLWLSNVAVSTCEYSGVADAYMKKTTPLPDYARDIKAAWELWTTAPPEKRLHEYSDDAEADARFVCMFGGRSYGAYTDYEEYGGQNGQGDGIGPTVAIAICRAYLKALQFTA